MKIQIASDLHTEFGSSPLLPSDIGGEALVLAGDISGTPKALARYLRSLSGTVPILYVMGNHEFFNHDFVRVVSEYRDAVASVPGVVFLENGSTVIGGVRFLGCTLWTDFFDGTQGEACERGLNDFRFISGPQGGRLRWGDVAARHRDSLAWLRRELRTPFSGSTVVVTHHAPSALSNPPQFDGSPISGGFYSPLDDLVEETQPALWIHGHMHDSSDYVIGGTRVVCNPFGYEGIETNVDWDPERRVDVR